MATPAPPGIVVSAQAAKKELHDSDVAALLKVTQASGLGCIYASAKKAFFEQKSFLGSPEI